MFRRNRIGTITLALTLVGLGSALLIANLTGRPSLHIPLTWWPTLLIVLGLEVLVRFRLQSTGDDAASSAVRWDYPSIALLTLLIPALALGNFLMGIPGLTHAATAALGLDVEVVEQLEQPLMIMPGSTLTVSNPYGAVSVVAVPENTATYRVKATVRARDITKDAARALAADVQIMFEPQPGPAITVVPPPHHRAQSIVVDITLHVPATTSVSAAKVAGELQLTGLNGRTIIAQTHGDVRLHGLRGGVVVRDSYRIAVVDSELAEGLQVEGRRSHIELMRIKGDVKVRAQGGSVDIVAVDGPIQVQAQEAHVRLSSDRIGGDVTIVNDGGPIDLTVSGSGYNLDLQALGGAIIAQGVTADLDASPDRQRLSTTIGDLDNADSAGLPMLRANTVNDHIRLTVR